jgi:hypothetical protein
VRLARREWPVLAAIIALAVGVPLVAGIASGRLDLPHNDDYDYRRIALTFWSSGTLEMRGFSVMSLFGQVLFVQPFLWLSGGAPWAFAAATASLTIAGLVSGYLLLRRVLDTARTALALLAVVLVPGFLGSTTSFMTDLPAFGSELVCLALGAAAIERNGRISWRLLIASLAVGCFGVSIRESALAAPVAVIVVAAMADARGPRREIAAAVALLATAAAIHFLAASIPGQGVARFDPGPGLSRLRGAFSTLALFLCPVLVVAIAWWRSRWRLVDVLPGLLMGIVVDWGAIESVAKFGRLPSMLIGNVFTLSGPTGAGLLDGSRPVIYPIDVWTGVQIAAFAATILLPGVITGILGSTLRHGGVSRQRIRDWSRSPASLLVVFTLFTAAGLAMYGYAFTMFDRYLWPLVLTGSALLLIRPASVAGPSAGPTLAPSPAGRIRRAPWLALGLLAVLGCLSVVNLLASDAFAVARWRFGETAVATGVPASHVDAGMEWVGYFAVGRATAYAPPPRGQMWYTGWWPSFRLCATVSSSRIERRGFVLLLEDRAAYRQFGPIGRDQPLYLYRFEGPGCP